MPLRSRRRRRRRLELELSSSSTTASASRVKRGCVEKDDGRMRQRQSRGSVDGCAYPDKPWLSWVPCPNREDTTLKTQLPAIPQPADLRLTITQPFPMSAAPPGLFKLPRELRDYIYHLCFLSSGFGYIEGDLVVDVCYGQQRWASKPRWIWTNKQVLDEALVQFYRHAHLKSYVHNRSQGRPSDQHPVFTVGRLQKLELWHDIGVSVTEGDDGRRLATIALGAPEKSIDPGLQGMLGTLARRGSAIKDLRVSFEMGVDVESQQYLPFPAPDSIDEWTIDLSPLLGLGANLRNVQFNLQRPLIQLKGKEKEDEDQVCCTDDHCTVGTSPARTTC